MQLILYTIYKRINYKITFTITFRCINDSLSLNNLSSMIILTLYIQELENKHPTDAPKWASYIDLRLEFDEDGRLYKHPMTSVMTL